MTPVCKSSKFKFKFNSAHTCNVHITFPKAIFNKSTEPQIYKACVIYDQADKTSCQYYLCANI